jgi:hypothetical protein
MGESKDITRIIYIRMRGCNPSFQSNYANFDGVGTKSVKEYLEGDLRSTPRCIPHNHQLMLVNGSKNRPHFRHKHSADLEGSRMTNWHAEWQSHFPITEVPFRNQYGQTKERRADAVIPEFKRIIEIQHSPIESSEVANRNKDYALHGHNVTWIIDAQKAIVVKNMGGRRILSFELMPWLYEHFLPCEAVYYDVGGFIYQVNPNHIKSHQVDVGEPLLKSDFIEALKTQETLFVETPPQSYLHVKQQGAGSGKTFGVIQLLNSDPEITHYQWILFITKQHAAVNVMYSEFKDQCTKGLLPCVEILGDVLYENKKYIVHYRHSTTNVETCAVFATVDSFTYAVGQASQNASDQFASIIKSIKDGYSKVKHSGSLKFAGVDPFINKESIVIIDEAQDLTELYGEAFLKFVSTTHTNMCVVGDRLQSLNYTDNALTLLHRAEAAMMRVVRTEASNVVRRFSDPQLIRFVNSMIPFARHDLPPIAAAVTASEVPGAVTVFKGKTIYANKSEDDEDVVKAVADVMELFAKEIRDKKRLPEDFLIVTPFTSKNPLVESLQLAINTVWKDIMENDAAYIEAVKSKHPYWKSVDPNDYTRYAIFHKSQEMGSINLSESEHATRIVSIHSAKGDGRKVVFVIGVTQSALQMFSQVAGNLIYDSLIHVAITRQKETLYFRLEENGDDVHRRISKSGVEVCAQNNTEFDFAKKTIKLSKISDDILNFSFDELYENVICRDEPPRPPPLSEEKLLIDMGDHNIRYASMFMNIIVHICNNAHTDTKKQFYAILGNLKPELIKPVDDWKGYISVLFKNNKVKGTSPDTNADKKFIPLLHFKTSTADRDYNKYFTIIYQTMLRIVTELGLVKSRRLRYFCPLECVVLYYMMECVEQGTYQAITINDVYNIVDTYRHAFDSTSRGHDHCDCKSHFPPSDVPRSEAQKKQSEYLRNHYDRVEHVSAILDIFVKENPKVNWLYQHGVQHDNDCDEFNIATRFPLLGYDDDRVYAFTIKPQFNELNFNKVMVDTLCDTWILGNTSPSSGNYKRLQGKPVLSCVISLNRTELYTVDWTRTVIENHDFLVNTIYHTLLNKFAPKHEQYYNTFMYTMKEVEGAQKILDACKKNIDDKSAPYIEKGWTYIEGHLCEASGKREKLEVLEKYAGKDNFIKMFDGCLDRSLMKLLHMEEDEEE